jgi:mannobiose 2-epimerase
MQSDVLHMADHLKQHALQEVIGFWEQHGLDAEGGGYWTDLARDGTRYGDGEKWIIVQTRCIYGFCLAYQLSGDKRYLDQAAQGVAFFRQHFRDRQNGGWYYCVSRDGSQVLDSSKQPYGLAFACYALAEYGRLSGDRAALADAVETQDLVMAKCWDAHRGGLPNKFTADWQLEQPLKRVDTHMHTMEGVSALYHATADARYLQRLDLLANTILGKIGASGCYDAAQGCTHEVFHMDWREATEVSKGLTNYGHVTEAGWFIAKLAGYTGDARQAALAKGLVEWAIHYGLDAERGGLHDYGDPATGAVVRSSKQWWNQSELLGALAYFFRITGEGRYWELFLKHWAFVDRFFVDHTYGEWYADVNADGSLLTGEHGPRDFKGSRWKASYHVMQGLYHPYYDLRRAAGVETVCEPRQWADYCL